ncbi:mechanosensitive ion channel domain-containing protein [Geoglobus acetivorans]|uniref:Mechanosensitive ion channel family protein n=1 Tax=Geoglobus acetivorans TaxID=565033 RepID=A0ABZ3H562_GEOAI|nr:mechanosensitive ion channel family protein [Geoglobus acetivorans]
MIDLLGVKIYGDVTIGNFLIAIFIISFGVFLAKVLTTNLRRTLGDRIEKNQRELVLKVVYYIIVLVAFLTALPFLGLNPSGLLVAGGITGIVLGFASQSVVSNFISGIFILWEKPVKIGDQISVAGISGYVEDIGIMSTIVRTYDGLYVRIPNNTLFTSEITNLTGNVARRFEYVIGIRYSDDVDRAVEIIRGVIEKEPFALKNPAPAIFVNDLGDSSVNIVVRIWSPVQVWYDVKMALLSRIKEELEKNGIEIPFPQRVIWFANEPEMKHRRGE